MRTLASFGAVNQESDGKFTLNTVSKTFRMHSNEAAMEFCLEFLTPGWLALPEYLKSIEYRMPTEAEDTPMHRAHNKPPGTSIWEMISTTSHAAAASTYIANFNEGHKDWLDFYPVEERLGKGADGGADGGADAVMMVDVGGGPGHQALNLKKRFPQLPGRYIVQDLPHTFPKDAERDPGIEYMHHDFTTVQPVKGKPVSSNLLYMLTSIGARLYYLRYIPQDWPQHFVVNLMQHLAKAMKPGYSRLIVNE